MIHIISIVLMGVVGVVEIPLYLLLFFSGRNTEYAIMPTIWWMRQFFLL